jgi:predicted transcriptional regulator of viral defense system
MPSRLSRRRDRFTRPSVLELVRRQGLLRSRDLEAHGIPRTELRLMLGLGALEEVAPGVWGGSVLPFDATTVAAKRVPQGVVCLLSALYFHGLLREEPPEAWLAIGEKARKPRFEKPPLRIVRFSGAALSEGIELHTVRGVPVRVFSVAKTVADLFKYRGKLGYPVAVRALRDAFLTGRCTQEELLRYGAICRVTRILEPYLQVLVARRAGSTARVLASNGGAQSAGGVSLHAASGLA